VDRERAGAPALPETGAAFQAILLAGLVCLLPFEPRRPVLPVLGFELTLLEAAAGLLALPLFWLGRKRLRDLARRPPLPLVCITLYALAHVLSALAAPENGGLAGKFALRMVAMAAFAWLAAAVPAGHRAALFALAAISTVIAAAALAEALGLRALDPLLDRFREMPFNVAGARRATAFSEYPNLAASFVMCGLLAGVGLLSARGAARFLAAPFAALLGAGLLFTYSRGALVATGFGLLVLAAVVVRRPPRRLVMPAVAALLALGVCAGSFAWAGEVFRLRLGGEGTDRWYLAEYAPEEMPLHLRAGELRTTPVRVANAGLKTWARDEAFHLSYHWWDRERQVLADGERTRLPRDLTPGDSAVLHANVRAPAQPGQYLLVWDMVHEHTTWFSGQGVAPRTVPVVVGTAPLAGALASADPDVAPVVGWQPGRAELWRLALGMWRERPLLGVGADNFRWLYGPRAGHAFWDTRVFANNLYLEAAATTGTLGLLAIVATLGTALFAAARVGWRRPALLPAAAALCGVLAAVAAHGMVDYLLASTGHYLLLAVAVGLAASLPREVQA
jgi:O-Antigen ligase